MLALQAWGPFYNPPMLASGTLLQRCSHSRVLEAKLTPQSYGFFFAQILLLQGLHVFANHFKALLASHLADLNNEPALFSHFLCASQIGPFRLFGYSGLNFEPWPVVRSLGVIPLHCNFSSCWLFHCYLFCSCGFLCLELPKAKASPSSGSTAAFPRSLP